MARMKAAQLPLQWTRVAKSLEGSIAFIVQFALDKVRPPVKPGVSHGAILRYVRFQKLVQPTCLVPDENAGSDADRCFEAAGADHLFQAVGYIEDVIRLHL